MAIQGAHEFTARGGPDLDGSIPAGGHNILLIKVNHIDGSPMTDENTAQRYLAGRGHVPDGDRAVLRAGHHHAVVEAQMQHRLAVMDEGVDHLAGIDVPYANCGVAGPTDDYLVIVLQAQHRSSVANEGLQTDIERCNLANPSMYSIIP